MNMRALLGALAVSVVLCPALAWPGDATTCRESCGEQAGHTFATCIHKKGRTPESCEDGAHDAFAACVSSRCHTGADDSCAAHCDALGAEIRAQCLEVSNALGQCEELGEATRGRCATEQC